MGIRFKRKPDIFVKYQFWLESFQSIIVLGSANCFFANSQIQQPVKEIWLLVIVLHLWRFKKISFNQFV
ncbi:hypothetical protein FRX31_014179 [Thalictrum thalictroides]|uniref:Uncharacterized protein n=1 Tax=Thalictrum thalictroides TaxID=46969 RepID=A0A7J6WFL5_THATH|nr:hypothetical protein FRX31_014179 [Thalictrum thalictroides]